MNKKIIAIILSIALVGSGSGYLIYSYINGNLFNPDSISENQDTQKNNVDFDEKVDKVDDKKEEEKKPEEKKNENNNNENKNNSGNDGIKSRGNIYISTAVKSNKAVYNNDVANIGNDTSSNASGNTAIISDTGNSANLIKDNNSSTGKGNNSSGNGNNSNSNNNANKPDDSNDNENGEDTPATVIKPAIDSIKVPEKETAVDAWENMGIPCESYDPSNPENASKSLNLYIDVADDDIMNASVKFYDGEPLTDINILKQVNAFAVSEFFEDGSPNLFSAYKLRDFNENFYVKDYPEKAYEGFTATFCFRATRISPWQEETVSFSVVDRKLVVLTYEDGKFANYNDSIKLLYPEADKKINLLWFYLSIYNEDEEISMLFRGFSDTLNGEPIDDDYYCTNKGLTFLYPAGFAELDEKYKVRMEKELDPLSQFSLEFEGYQTLYDYTDDTTQTLKVPQYISQVKFDTYHTFDKMVLSSTIKKLSLKNDSNEFTLDVKKEFIVNKDNKYFSTINGILTSKEQDKVYAIPTELTNVTFGDSIKSINISQINSLKELHLGSNVPEINLENLNNAKIYVPKDAYLDYLSAWGGKLGNNQLLNEDESKAQYIYTENAVYSEDMKTLYSITNEASGIFIVPESVETIATDAMKNCPNVNTLIIQQNVNKIEERSINTENLTRIYILGKDNIISINESTFINSDNLDSADIYVQSSVFSEYYDLLYTTMGGGFANVFKSDDIELTSINNNQVLKSNKGNILIKADANITSFDENTLGETEIAEIGANAFENNQNLKYAELGESIKIIDNNAFKNCKNLETFYSKSSDEITVNSNVFYNVPNLKYAAFNAQVGNIADDFENTAKSYVYYAPYSIEAEDEEDCIYVWGYNYSFTFITPYGTPYKEISCGDGKILYGYNDYLGDDGGVVLCSATREISKNIKLLDNTLMIWKYAFYNCANEFTLQNYNDIENIGEKSFASSGLCVSYEFGNITAIDFEAFASCKNLTKLSFAYLYKCDSNVFSNCENLSKITLTSATVPMLNSYDYYAPFSFGDNIGTNCGGFNIELKGETDADTYIDTWKYYFAGKNPIFDYGTLTEEEDINAQNTVRKLFGMVLLEYSAQNKTPEDNGSNAENQNDTGSQSGNEEPEENNIALNNETENKTDADESAQQDSATNSNSEELNNNGN